jgi:2-polyprenyl-3-methyl-5-hydroxy-6-metoxy-1,4-benzoquinol methylase
MLMKLAAEQDWIRLGNIEPYYGVISNPKYRVDCLDESAKATFYATGTWHVGLVLAALRDAFAFVPHGVALDFGCGVGRVSSALAQHFDKVVGLDISPGMITRANHYANDMHLTNVVYASSDQAAWLAPEQYDFVHTYLVLQHIPVARGMKLIADLVRSVKSGGVGAIHLTYNTSAGWPTLRLLKNFVINTRLLRNIANIMMGRAWNFPAMQMNAYNLPAVYGLLAAAGISDFKCTLVDDWGHLGLFIFFQKPHNPNGHSAWSNPVQRANQGLTRHNM